MDKSTENKKINKETIKKVFNKESYTPKKKKIKVMFKNHTRIWWKTYQPRKIVELDSISWFERYITVVK